MEGRMKIILNGGGNPRTVIFQEDKKSVYEVNRNKITKRIRYLSARFNSFNFTIEFFRSVFLVQHAWMPRHAPKQVGNALKLGMSIPAAFRMALDTWALWVQNTIDTNRTRVFFRTFEPSHWSDQTHRFCNVTRHPMSETEGTDRSLFSDATWEVVKKMTVPVTILHITAMSAFRSDAHVGKWNDNLSIADCSHWCLPGVPDMWNEILLYFLLYQP
ncbi:hypothetical protein GH714_021597 [Hevea brasiliensis]|uniref:Trichome birefringence-like C-terminal domain-containing protein n=1 Tax=Hevea brasiliensis TaxID=3981 RepID=A0A6A6K6N8_HEVBR|nr:hypothetical protein GH714_021597 [Hevea brasiliensis]